MTYTKYGPFTDGSSPGISAAFLNQVENYLRQNTGTTEVGKYFLASGIYASGAVMSDYIRTMSQGTTVAGVTGDTADLAPTGGVSGSINFGSLSSGGFQVYSLSTTGPNVNARMGGNWTASF